MILWFYDRVLQYFPMQKLNTAEAKVLKHALTHWRSKHDDFALKNQNTKETAWKKLTLKFSCT